MIEDADLPEKNFRNLYCDHCPVIKDCFKEGFWNQYEGVWGGTTTGERKYILNVYKELVASKNNEDSVHLTNLLSNTLRFPLTDTFK